MKCPKPEMLSAYLERDLSADRSAVIHAHIEACPACQREFTALASMAAGLRDLPVVTFSSGDYDRLMGAARVAHPPTHLTRYRPALALAAAMVLSFGIGFVGSNLYSRSAPGPEPAAYGLQTYLSDHRGYETMLAADSEFNVQVALTE